MFFNTIFTEIFSVFSISGNFLIFRTYYSKYFTLAIFQYFIKFECNFQFAYDFLNFVMIFLYSIKRLCVKLLAKNEFCQPLIVKFFPGFFRALTLWGLSNVFYQYFHKLHIHIFIYLHYFMKKNQVYRPVYYEVSGTKTFKIQWIYEYTVTNIQFSYISLDMYENCF